MQVIQVTKLPIKLAAFLKFAQVATTGGQARILIQAGEVRVNDRVEYRSGRQLESGDVVHVEGVATFRLTGSES